MNRIILEDNCVTAGRSGINEIMLEHYVSEGNAFSLCNMFDYEQTTTH